MTKLHTQLVTVFSLSEDEANKAIKTYGEPFLIKAMKRTPFKNKTQLRATIKIILKYGMQPRIR